MSFEGWFGGLSPTTGPIEVACVDIALRMQESIGSDAWVAMVCVVCWCLGCHGVCGVPKPLGPQVDQTLSACPMIRNGSCLIMRCLVIGKAFHQSLLWKLTPLMK